MNSPKKQAYVVTGMHRSGTSILSALTTCFGSSIGQNVMKPLPENPRGFWENQSIADMNDEILRTLGARWDLPKIEPWSETAHLVEALYLDKVKQLISVQFRDTPRITIKDPRIAFVLPLWIKALDDLGYGTKVLHIVRNPDEVYQSIHHRNGFSHTHSDLLWLETISSILSSSLPELLLIQHNHLYKNHRDTISSVSDYLGLDPCKVTRVIEEFEANHFDKQLRHYRAPESFANPDTEAHAVYKAICEYQGISTLNESELNRLYNKIRELYPESHAILGKLNLYLDPASHKDHRYASNHTINWVSSTLLALQESATSTLQTPEYEPNQAMVEQFRFMEEEIQQLSEEVDRSKKNQKRASMQFEYRLLQRIRLIDNLATSRDQLEIENHTLSNEVTQLRARIDKLEETHSNSANLHQSTIETANEFARCFQVLHDKIWSTKRWRFGSAAAHAWQKITRKNESCESKRVLDYTQSRFQDWVISLSDVAIRESTNDTTVLPVEPENHQIADTKQAHACSASEKLDLFLSNGEILDFSDSTKRADVSIILVLYNRVELTLLCLESILNRVDKLTVQLIIVDNASSDQTDELLNQVRGAKIIRNRKNFGFLLASNQGLAFADADQTLFLNNDALISTNALTRAHELLETRPELGAVGARIISVDGKLQEAGCICWSDGSTFGYGRGDDPEAFRYLFERYVDYTSGAFLQVRTALLKQLEGFDTRYEPAYYEDADICFGLNSLGYKILYSPEIVVYHYEFGSSEGSDYAVQLCQTNKQKFVAKYGTQLKYHYPPHQAVQLARFSTRWRNKRVLYVDDRTPHLYFGAGFPRSNFILNSLADFGFEVAMLPLNFPNEETKLTLYTDIDRRVELLYGIGRSSFKEFWDENADTFDLVWVSRPHNMDFLYPFLRNRRCKLVYDAEAIFTDRHLAMSKLGLSKPHESYEEAVKDELFSSRNADLIVTVSERDKSTVSQTLNNNRPVIDLGYGLEVKNAKGFSDRTGFLFVGNLDYSESPNSDSLRWFVETVWPLIKHQIPSAKLDVVGSNNSTLSTTLVDRDIIMHGVVESLDGFYQSSKVFIAPTRYAAGIPLKVQEAAANGIPCVITDILKKQLKWQHKKEALSSPVNDAESFCKLCVQLYEDETLWRNIQAGAQQAVLQECNSDQIKAKLMGAINELLI